MIVRTCLYYKKHVNSSQGVQIRIVLLTNDANLLLKTKACSIACKLFRTEVGENVDDFCDTLKEAVKNVDVTESDQELFLSGNNIDNNNQIDSNNREQKIFQNGDFHQEGSKRVLYEKVQADNYFVESAQRCRQQEDDVVMTEVGDFAASSTQQGSVHDSTDTLMLNENSRCVSDINRKHIKIRSQRLQTLKENDDQVSYTCQSKKTEEILLDHKLAEAQQGGSSKQQLDASDVEALKHMPQIQLASYEPLRCTQCSAVLIPYARVDYAAKMWICPCCGGRNHFPPHYHQINEVNVPLELHESCTTIEYKMTRPPMVIPPAYLFVLDTCLGVEELNYCKSQILQALQTMPEYALVGLITFATHVHVHELGFQECPKCYVFRGSKEYKSEQIVEQLGLGRAMQRGSPGQGQGVAPTPQGGIGRFMVPFGEVGEDAITLALEDLQPDAFPTVAEHRGARCTGTALQVASSLLRGSIQVNISAVQILLFVGGPATEGPGLVVGKELDESIRAHKDLIKEEAKHWRKALKFYDGLAQQYSGSGHVLNVLACSLDQVGLAEMKGVIECTGGRMIMADTFGNPVFKESLKRMLLQPNMDNFLGIGNCGQLEVIPSRDIKVAGMLGAGTALERKSAFISDNVVGLGGTNAWKIPGMDNYTSCCVFFDIVGAHRDAQESQQALTSNQQCFIQFITKYLHSSGEIRSRVTTLTRMWCDGSNPHDLISGFDQETAAVVMARIASWKMETEEDFDATRWLDRNLIRLCQRFGDYRKDDPQSFTLDVNMSYYPQFMFNLRRSQFVQVFGHSPDETAYFRHLLNRQPVRDGIVMIQPVLTAFHFQGPPEPVLLDVSSLKADHILLLDSLFYVVVWHGQTIAQWRDAGYQTQEQYKDFAQLLKSPAEEALELIKGRFPVPRLVVCDFRGSQERFLLAKLNPSSTYNQQSAVLASSEVINTDDVSLEVFTEHLKKLAVQS
eukprot:TRINITY_DN2104_c0_g2_i4.p1 TRINITY_DN2104_c0_g2~~TRINITY_DN2104_c0_g2_i4.p1  ORF type:complete len:1015 (-),score=160.46 TRINITY_DN2104_c0_g2_i4:299-3193(-)